MAKRVEEANKLRKLLKDKFDFGLIKENQQSILGTPVIFRNLGRISYLFFPKVHYDRSILNSYDGYATRLDWWYDNNPTEEDKEKLMSAVVSFINGDTSIYFSTTLGGDTTSIANVIKNSKRTLVERIEEKKELSDTDISLLSNLARNKFKSIILGAEDGNAKLSEEIIGVNDDPRLNYVSEIVGTILKKNDGEVTPLISDPIVAELISVGYSPAAIKIEISNIIQKWINNPLTDETKAAGLSVVSYKQIMNNLRATNSEREDKRIVNMTQAGETKDGAAGTRYDWYTIADKPGYYPREGKTFPGIPKSAISGEVDLSEGETELAFAVDDIYIGPQVKAKNLSWYSDFTVAKWFDTSDPTQVIGKYPEWYNTFAKGFLKVLEGDNSFSGIDITQYNFKYLSATNISKGYLTLALLWIFPTDVVEWFEGRELDPNGRINELFNAAYGFFLASVLMDLKDGRLGDSPAVHFEKIYLSRQTETDKETLEHPSFVEQMFHFIIADKEAARRVAKFKALVKKTESDPGKYLRQKGDESSFLTKQDEIDANASSAEEFLDNNGTPLPSVGKNGTEEKNIEGRGRFFKQCALILNLEKINNAFVSHLNLKEEIPRQNPKKAPFDGRFHMLKHNTSQELIISNLISPIDGREFFEVPPHVLSTLTPKLRLYRVENKKDENGQLTETEFIFPQRTDIDRVKDYKRPQEGKLQIPDNFLSARFDKGEGCGLKEFSFEFNGTNPAESRNDIKATMKLYFQTFADFIRKRKSKNGKEYSFVDLIVQPVNEATNDMVNQIKLIHPNQYDPSFYRIRAEIGYNYPDNLDSFYDRSSELRNAIDLTNKSFYLCMVDHELNIDIDGTVEITISYRAYAETALKSLRYDALSTPELITAREKALKSYKEALESNDCNLRQLRDLKTVLSLKEEEAKKRTLQSIIKRLLNDGKIYIAQVARIDVDDFRNNNSFTRQPELIKIGSEAATSPSTEIATGGGDTNAVGFILQNNLPSDDKKFNYNDIVDGSVQWFYFGDLLYTILDSMYHKDKDEGPDFQRVGLERIKFILGSFDFSSPFDDKIISGINIASIPISVDFFMKWFTDNVISQGQTRKSFPILTFVRNLCNNLLGPSLLENCVNKDEVKTLRFSTGQISAYSEAGDPLTSLSKTQKIIKLPQYDKFPLAGAVGGFEDSKINNFYTYLTLMVHGGGLTYDGKGVYSQDVRDGRYHIDIGSNKGIVKKVNFSKTDMQYIREARFFQHGFDGLMQLSNVYKATIEMFGNTLFYPGNELFINPYGFGGPALGRPQDGVGPDGTNERSLANILGLGGYHTIISIKSTITPGDYSTTIQAQQYYTGDGSGNPNLNGKKRLTNLRKEKERKLEDKHTTGDSLAGDACDKILIDTIYSNVLINEQQRLRAGERDYIPPMPPQAPSPPLDIRPPESDVPNTEAERDFLVLFEDLPENSGEYKTAFQPTDANGVASDNPIIFNFTSIIKEEGGDTGDPEDPFYQIYTYYNGEELVATITYDQSEGGVVVLKMAEKNGFEDIYEASSPSKGRVEGDPFPSNADDETDLDSTLDEVLGEESNPEESET